MLRGCSLAGGQWRIAAAALLSALFVSSADAQVIVSDSSIGYIDNAVPGNQLRLRFDAAYGNDFPDRAEFFYPKCGCFRVAGVDPDAPGPPEVETEVDYQDIRSHLEFAPTERFSVFGEFPVRFLNPEQNDNTAGFADMNAGFKYAFVRTDCTVATAQLRTYIPTGDASRGLGTDHASLEPGLLVFHRLSDRLNFEGELRDWIPIDGTDFAGNVLRYGVGLSYAAVDNCSYSVRPVGEVVGWSVLDGRKFNGRSLVTQDADGDTIVNLKLGVRIGFGRNGLSLPGTRNSFYAGYGRALTGDVWYDDIARFEYRMTF